MSVPLKNRTKTPGDHSGVHKKLQNKDDHADVDDSLLGPFVWMMTALTKDVCRQ